MLRKAEILAKVELRQSSIKDFLQCPLQFRFKHIENLEPGHRHPAALHGSTIHKLLYIIHDSKWNMKVEKYYRGIFEEFEFSSEESHIPVCWKDRQKELQAFEDNAVEILNNYRAKSFNQDAFVILAETPFRVKVCGQVFTGTIDQVRQNKDGSTELIDFKTNKQRPGEAFLSNDYQLLLYTYALRFGEFKIGEEWIKMNMLPTYSSWYFLRHHEVRKRKTVNGNIGDEKGPALLRTRKNMEDLKLFRKDVKNLLKNMLKDAHYPNPDHCILCGYKQVCSSRRNPIPDALVAEAQEILQQMEVS